MALPRQKISNIKYLDANLPEQITSELTSETIMMPTDETKTRYSFFRKKIFALTSGFYILDDIETHQHNNQSAFARQFALIGRKKDYGMLSSFHSIKNTTFILSNPLDPCNLNTAQQIFLSTTLDAYCAQENRGMWFFKHDNLLIYQDSSQHTYVVVLRLTNLLLRRTSAKFPRMQRYEVYEGLKSNNVKSKLKTGISFTTLVQDFNHRLHPKICRRFIKQVDTTNSDNFQEDEGELGKIAGIGSKAPYQDDSTFTVIMDHIPGINLYHWIIHSRRSTTKPHFSQLLQMNILMFDALLNLSDRGIVHRDIKPLNCIFYKNYPYIKLVDHGLSKKWDLDDRNTKVGTRGYRAPETLNQLGTSAASDMFATVITLFIMCGAILTESNYLDCFQDVVSGKKTCDQFDLETILTAQQKENIDPSHIARLNKLYKSIMHPDPQMRPSMADARFTSFSLMAEGTIFFSYNPRTYYTLAKTRKAAISCGNELADAKYGIPFNVSIWQTKLAEVIETINNAAAKLRDYNDAGISLFLDVLHIKVLAGLRTKQEIKAALLRVSLDFESCAKDVHRFYSANGEKHLQDRYLRLTVNNVSDFIARIKKHRMRQHTGFDMFQPANAQGEANLADFSPKFRYTTDAQNNL